MFWWIWVGKYAEQVIYNYLLAKSLNPCFGGFGWERYRLIKFRDTEVIVLILVLVDLGGKGKAKR